MAADKGNIAILSLRGAQWALLTLLYYRTDLDGGAQGGVPALFKSTAQAGFQLRRLPGNAGKVRFAALKTHISRRYFSR
jgi:hypothetical protein